MVTRVAVLFFAASTTAQAACVWSGSAWGYVSCVYDEVVIAQADIEALSRVDDSVAVAYSDVYETYSSGGGASPTRALTFIKGNDDTALKISYSETLEDGAWHDCHLEVRFDGDPCTVPGPIFIETYEEHAATTSVTGVCLATQYGPIESGTVYVDVFVEPLPDGTCWLFSPATLLVQEVPLRP